MVEWFKGHETSNANVGDKLELTGLIQNLS
jgi:hypothetical protein